MLLEADDLAEGWDKGIKCQWEIEDEEEKGMHFALKGLENLLNLEIMICQMLSVVMILNGMIAQNLFLLMRKK